MLSAPAPIAMASMRESTATCTGLLGQIIEARAGSTYQLASYVAVAKGLRPALDDFVPVGHYQRFSGLMRALGLAVRPDVVFGHVRDESRFPSLRLAPTTKAIGMPWNPEREYEPGCELHVFVGRGQEQVDAAWRSGWYPVVIGGRIIQKPKVDHVRFGQSLGYPACCIEAFERYNRWGRYDHISEAARRSEAFRFVNNCFAKYTPYMLNFHIPCRFDCAASRRLGEAILGELAAIDPAFSDRVRANLGTPVLHVSERLNFGLPDAAPETDRRWRYGSVVDIYALITGRDRRHDVLKRMLEWGNAVEITAEGLVITNVAGDRQFFECRVDEGVIENHGMFYFSS